MGPACLPIKSILKFFTAHEENRRLTQELREKLKDESVQALPEGYFEEGFDPPLYELQGMPASFQVSARWSLPLMMNLNHSGVAKPLQASIVCTLSLGQIYGMS